MDRDLFRAGFYCFLFVVILVIIGAIVGAIRDAYADVPSPLLRCAPYRKQVEYILKAEAVNTDFYYLMVAESRCTDNAVSPKGATGFWQLMPSTGRHYGCRDLHDLECATRAAARYIRHLQSSFDSFDDIIIAYNMGGRNYKRRGASKQAKGLVYTVKQLIRADGGNHDNQ